MLKSKKKEVKKQKPKPQPKQKQKQKQTQSTRVTVNIGKTKKSKSSKPATPPAPVRPQVIPVYTPTYQSQQQQQAPPYNLEDFRTLFKARENTRPNIQQEILRDVVEQTQAPAQAPAPRPALALDAERGQRIIEGLQVEAEARRQGDARRAREDAERQRQAEVQQRREDAERQRLAEVQQRRDEARRRREERAEVFYDAEGPAPAPAPAPAPLIVAPEPEPAPAVEIDIARQFANPPAQQALALDYLEPVINRPAVEFVDDAELARQLQQEEAGQPNVARDLNAFFQEPPPAINAGRAEELAVERQAIEQGFYPQTPALDDALKQGAQPELEPEITDEFFELNEEEKTGPEQAREALELINKAMGGKKVEEEPPAGGGGGGGGGGGAQPAEEPAFEDLDDLNYKEIKRLVDRYNTENRTNKIQITKPNLVGKGTTPKSKPELLAEYKAKIRGL